MATINERVLIDPSGAGGVRTNGGMYVCGKAPGNRLQILHNSGTSPINIGPVFEHNEDVRIVEHGLGAYRFHPRRSQERGHDRVGDLVFDDVGWLAFPIGVDDYLHVGNVRQCVQRNMAHGPESCEGE